MFVEKIWQIGKKQMEKDAYLNLRICIFIRFEDCWMLEDCLFCTYETVKSQNTFLKVNGVCSIQYKFA